jgi:hypothetical protein
MKGGAMSEHTRALLAEADKLWLVALSRKDAAAKYKKLHDEYPGTETYKANEKTIRERLAQ